MIVIVVFEHMVAYDMTWLKISGFSDYKYQQVPESPLGCLVRVVGDSWTFLKQEVSKFT